MPWRGRGTRAPDAPSRRAWLALFGWLLLVGLLIVAPAPLHAQQARVVGQVQWIAGSRMQVLTEDGTSFAIDLTEADQSSYRALRLGDWVVISGVVSADRRRIVARDIWRDDGRGGWTQSP
jgi:hypothetical protein